jgi:hypothetical protein
MISTVHDVVGSTGVVLGHDTCIDSYDGGLI